MKCDNRFRCYKYVEMDCNHVDYWVNCPDYKSYQKWLADANKNKEDLSVWTGINWDKVVSLEERRRVEEAGGLLA